LEETRSKVTKVEHEVSLAETKIKHLNEQVENLNKELEEAKKETKPVVEVPVVKMTKEETLLAKWGEMIKEENKEENQEQEGDEDSKRKEVTQVQEEY